ncbi:MAG: hypothetical protein WA855_11475 [Candidatus Acidiferrales bacterium]
MSVSPVYSLRAMKELSSLEPSVIVIGAFSLVRLFGRTKDSMETERERRSFLNRVGRIVDGQVLEIVEGSAEQSRSPQAGLFGKRRAEKAKTPNHKMLLYTYSISGVTYEAAQDISGLEEQACLERVVAGQAVGVKYDPANPSNSILIADDWSGLR